MKTNLTYRWFFIGLVLLISGYLIWPSIKLYNLSDETRAEMKKTGDILNLEKKAINLGLDLQGGMYVVLEVDMVGFIEGLASRKDAKLQKAIDEARASLEAEGDFFATLSTAVNEQELRLGRYFHDKGATNDEIIKQLKEESEDAINRVLEILRNRVDEFGVAEPNIQKQGRTRIVLELAGVDDPQRVKKLIGKTAKLNFTLLRDAETTTAAIDAIDELMRGEKGLVEDSSEVTTSTVKKDTTGESGAVEAEEMFGTKTSDTDSGTKAEDTSFAAFAKKKPFSALMRRLGNDIAISKRDRGEFLEMLDNARLKGVLPRDFNFMLSAEAVPVSGESGADEFYFLYPMYEKSNLSGEVVTNARASFGSQTGSEPVVNLTMNTAGARKWSRLTGANINKRIAISMDGKVYSAPVVRSKISGGRSEISGMADINEAKDLALVLRAGSLPVPVQVVEERTVGPSLGIDSIHQGTTSVIFGLILVIIFMIIWYKVSGVIADTALLLNLVLMLAFLGLLHATLTLPGIAGVILTIGMAVDANVIIFERIREELRLGRTVKTAIDRGYGKALSAVVDANITTMIASLVLLQFGSGPIKGFAVTLSIGIIISLFTAIFFSRLIYNTMLDRKSLQTLSI